MKTSPNPSHVNLPRPRFLNVDLIIESRFDLAALARETNKRVFVLHCGPFAGGYFLALETCRSFKTPEPTVRALCAWVDSLSVNGKRAWRSAFRREFDLGYDFNPAQRMSRFTLEAAAAQRIADVGASFAVTFYNVNQ